MRGGQISSVSAPPRPSYQTNISHSLGEYIPPPCMGLCLPHPRPSQILCGASDLTAISAGWTWGLTLKVGGELALRQDWRCAWGRSD